jgi:hypothetical protein
MASIRYALTHVGKTIQKLFRVQSLVVQTALEEQEEFRCA